MIDIYCVWWGDRYDERYVRRLQSMLARHCSFSYRLNCITDRTEGLWVGINWIPCISDAEGWWHKMQAFGYPGEKLIIDLDMIIMDDLHPCIYYGRYEHSLIAINRWDHENEGLNSGLMYVPEDYEWLWNAFYREGTRGYKNDQDFIGGLAARTGRWPDQWVRSYKKHIRKGEDPRDTKVVAFHGRPRPHEVDAEWLRRYWK